MLKLKMHWNVSTGGMNDLADDAMVRERVERNWGSKEREKDWRRERMNKPTKWIYVCYLYKNLFSTNLD